MLFGAIEMGLTTFVLGLLDRRDEQVVERAKDQVTQTILRGLLSPPAAEVLWNEKSEKSATKSKPVRRD
jgi:TetR/AcrR family fatty acid metabolism transcriptional regulator